MNIIEEFKKQGVPPRTVKLLTLIWPFPIGEAMKIKDAAKELGIKVNTAYQRLKELKKTCPLAYEKFRQERKAQSEIGQFLHRQAHLEEIHSKNAYLLPPYRRILKKNLYSGIENLKENLIIEGEIDDEESI